MDEEQISPELVLVDPELANRAREEMPWAAADVPWAEATPPASVPPSAPPARQPREGFPMMATLWLFAGLAVAVTLALELLPDRQPRPTLAAAPARTTARPVEPSATPPPAPRKQKPRPAAPRRTAPPPPAAKPPPPAPKPPPPPAPKPRTQPKPPPPPPAARPQPAPQPPPRQTTVPRRTQTLPAPVPGKTPPQPPPPSKPPPPKPGFQPARVFAWAPYKGATYYHVVIRKDGRLFYEAWPREARLAVPGRIKFSPGDYTWRVQPGLGPRSAKRLGPAIVESSFTLRG